VQPLSYQANKNFLRFLQTQELHCWIALTLFVGLSVFVNRPEMTYNVSSEMICHYSLADRIDSVAAAGAVARSK